jgi:hypothetical protein
MSKIKTVINQLFEIESKISELKLENQFTRNFERLNDFFESEGYSVIKPIGEKYSSGRTDYEASLIGDIDKTLHISKVLKPIIYQIVDNQKQLIQKGIVIAQ